MVIGVVEHNHGQNWSLYSRAGGYAGKGDIHHDRVWAGLTLTLDMAVSRAMGRNAGAKKGAKNAKMKGHVLCP